MSTELDNSLIIHGFAILHTATTVICYIAGIDDSLFLTIWTMAMTVLLCNNKQLAVEFTAVSVILSNVIGYVLGMAIASGVDMLTDIDFLSHAASTFVTTETIGWALVFLVPGSSKASKENPSWLWMTILLVFAARIIVGLLSSKKLFADASFSNAFSLVVTNAAVLLLVICVNIILLHRIHRGKGFKNKRNSILWHTALFLICPAIGVAMIALGIPIWDPNIPRSFPLYIEVYILTLIAFAAAYSIIFLVYYVASTRHQVAQERSKSQIARLEYLNLKQQVNPHFLFNSLNVLDALMATGKTEDARLFTRKLANIYRFMLSKENEALVTLEEELTHVKYYVDLLQIRFPSGIKTEISISEPSLSQRYVIKFSVQMLVENAYKHNAISESKPLYIKIVAADDKVTVSNNIQPRLSQVESTGVGLNYIQQNYLAHGKDIAIVENADNYCVSLPLL